MPLSTMTAETPANEAVEFDQSWTKTARDGFRVHISWRHTGRQVSGKVRDERGGETQFFTLVLEEPEPCSAILALTHRDIAGNMVTIDVTLVLLRKGDLLRLMCRLPVSIDKYFYDAIGEWPLGHPPSPFPDPDHDDDEEAGIEAPGDASDLFPFIWQYPLNEAEETDEHLRFITCEDAAVRTLYANMNAAQKLAAAAAYMKTDDYVSGLAKLPATIQPFPAACLYFREQRGKIAVADLVVAAEAELHITSLSEFLAGADWTTSLTRIWKSLCALALAQQPPTDTSLYAVLLDVLRVGQYLSLLAQDLIKDSHLLEDHASRQVVLAALAAFPDNVALLPPSPALSGADTATPPNSWEVLGVGKLKMARQHLAGYAPGELADVVNVMPRERQELLERTVTTSAERDNRVDERQLENDTQRETSAASELADTINEVMSAEGAAINMSNMTPAYSNLNLLLNGTGSNSGARSGWSSADLSRMVQRLTEQAAKRLGERISQQRGKEWQELRERRRSQLIDNANSDRLVGVYRWVDRVVRVHVEELGSRLVLAFSIDQPAKSWVATVAAQGTFPLQPPVALPTLAASYSAILASNYQSIGAQYGLLDLEPPPPAQLSLSATLSRVTLGDLSLLRVPDGYAVQSCSVTFALSDNTYNLACSVGGVDVPLAAAATPAPLKAIVPACTTTGTDPATITPENRATSVVSTQPVTGLKITTGCIPLTVISAAPLFSVTVTLSCALDVTQTGSPGSLMTAWQMRIYDRLQQAWRKASQSYDTDLAARIDLASAGHTGEVQRDTLKQACMALLLQASGSTGSAAENYRFLEPLFDWAHMTWQYQSATSAAGKQWPLPDTAEATRPSSDRLFRRFLAAQTAHVLLPVNRNWESGLLFYLQFQRLWPGSPAITPVTECVMPLLEALRRPRLEAAAPDVSLAGSVQRDSPRAVLDNWTVRVPTSMIYLQEGAELPRMRGADSPKLLIQGS
jgi:hypothetical protein